MSGPIGVFDSGVGGLTVVRAILERLPGESIVYFGDTARVPYGTKSRETIIKFALEDAGWDMKRVVPFDNLDWIGGEWIQAVVRCLEQRG